MNAHVRLTAYGLFALWILTGAAATMTLLGAFTIGIFFAPVTAVLFAGALTLSVVRPGRLHTMLGAPIPLPWAVGVVAASTGATGASIAISFAGVVAATTLGVTFGVLEGRRHVRAAIRHG